MSKDPIEVEDEDVAAEKERVLCGGASEDLIRIENLTKVSLCRTFFIGHFILRGWPGAEKRFQSTEVLLI